MPDISNIEIESRKQTEDEKRPIDEVPEIPKFYKRIKLTTEQEQRLTDDIENEFDAIKREQDSEDEQMQDNWESLENQYEGDIQDIEDQQFNLHKPMTKVKVDSVVRHAKEAFFDNDPTFSVSPRPEFARQGGHDISAKQEDYLDYKLDSVIPLREPMGRVLKSAVLKGTGILKWKWSVHREKKTREEIYRGHSTPVIDPRTQQPAVHPETGEPIMQNEELARFLENYPDALEKYPSIVKRLATDQTVPLTIEYTNTVYDDPFPEAVELKNFYCRINTAGYEGLKKTRLTVERQCYTWWEMKQLVKDGQFDEDKVDELKYTDDKQGNKVVSADFETDKYDILECVYMFALTEDGDEEKFVCWIEEDTKTVLAMIRYPFTGVQCYYVPHYIASEKPGFYQPGLGEYLTDTNLAEDALLNFILEGAWSANMITPITPANSDVDEQFLEKRWTHGVPINANPNDIDFLQNKMRSKPDINALMIVMNTLVRDDDDVTGISSLLTGRESPLDPDAPASKTIALLERSGINIKDYIRHLVPAFNASADIILQLTYQMTQEGDKRSFITRTAKQAQITGGTIFDSISRDEMVTRTNIQSQAYAFDFDRIQAKRNDLALLQMLAQWPLFTQNPDGVYKLLKTIVKGWSQKWRNIADQILPSPEEFKKQKAQSAIQAVGQVIQQTMEQEQMTGQPAPIDPNALLAVVQQLESEVTSPVPEEIQKQREEAQGA